MILSFKEKFIEPIFNKTKKHTIRADNPNRWKANNTIHFATGVRTKNYKCFAMDWVKSVQYIYISHYYPDNNHNNPIKHNVIIDNKLLSNKEIEILAKNDGFKSSKEFFDWFNIKFEGKIIHWTNLKY